MKKLLLLLMVGILALTLCACGASPATEETTEETAEPAVDNTTEEAATDAPYVVELKDAQLLTNFEGEQVFAVFYSFTNNSEETTSATVALYVKGFQDGVQLEPGYLAQDDLPADKATMYEADWKDIRPGTTIDCYQTFVLTSTSEVEVEVTELFSFDNTILASKTYSVQ